MEGEGSVSDQTCQEPANMAPVLNVLDKWGAETPFAQISESAVGGSVLAVSLLLFFCCFLVTFICIILVSVCSTDGNS